jgi:autotransporter strand-loop-strand O-heptosyltransferase
MIIKAHTSIIGETGYNCHSRNFFKSLDKLNPVQVRNFTIGSSWGGYNNDEPHNNEYYIDDQLKKMLTEQTLNTPDGRKEFPLYTSFKNEGSPDIHIVLNETNHYYFYDDYDGLKIAYNVWETTRQPDDFFEKLKTYDQVWVPSKWQRDCTIEQGISPDKVKVVPEGVDTNMYKPINRVVSRPTNRPFRFLLVGRWDYRKSTREIIESFIKTFSEDEDVEMILSVDNPFANDGLNSTEERLEKFGIRHKGLKVVHHLSKDEYANMIRTSDVFVSCARGEGWNLPLIEAMSSGIPSLYSNWGAQLEFADGKGIPIDISHERPAKLDDKDLSWGWDATGMFVEPNFNDLSHKMREVFENYSIYRHKALEDSDLIRERFTWENAAKIANKILHELIDERPKIDDSVAIVLAHANTPDRVSLLKDCIKSISIPVILSTNYPVDVETQTMCDWVVYSKENPILDSSDFEKYGLNYFHWWVDDNGNRFEEPYKCEHGYAAYSLTRDGLKFAKSIGKKKVHIINYDYTFSEEVLKSHNSELENNDIVFYKQNDWEFDGHRTYNSAFISAKIDPIYEFFSKYENKEDYYSSMSGFNILEIQLHHHYQNSSYKICALNIEDLKQKVKVNQECAYQHLNKLGEEIHNSKTFKEISDYFNCDKTTYHQYDKYYPIFLEKWRDKPINIFEIGIEDGKSLNIWKNYFPYSMIWGMDISRKYEGDRYKVFIGDQSKIDDLINISTQIPKCNLIVDDGSHIADHQIKTFEYLFENVLEYGGIYIIEDIECSYWHPLQTIYGYETGNLNIVDYFTKLNHGVNDHYNLNENELNIKSVTFGSNCIIVQKKEFYEMEKRPYRFVDKLVSPINTSNEQSSSEEIRINFIDGALVEINGETEKQYDVCFIDSSNNEIVHQSTLTNNTWTKTNRKWFTKWSINITNKLNNDTFNYNFDISGKKVFIVLESSSLGDTIAWIPYLEEFGKTHKCKVVASTFHNELFQEQYPDIEFVKPGSLVDNVYALYRLGVFYDENGFDNSRHKTDFTKLSLQEIACDILGLEYKEIRPRIKSIKQIKSEKPYICIANHSTAQPKYWNNPSGWQELVDYVKSFGYDVYLLSKEEDGHMGNKNPKGVIKIDGKSLEEIGSILLGSKGFVGLGSGLSWFSWALNVPTILISGFSEPYQEMKDVYRIINTDVCHGCFARHLFDRGDWNWCPDHKGTDRQFECTKSITFEMVRPKIQEILNG